MATPRARRKRSPTRSTSSSPEVFTVGVYQCNNFLTNNEYSEKTFGLHVFILRNTIGDIDFSDIFDKVEKCAPKGQTINFVTLLKEKRDKLPEIDASIEKRLMLNRLIKYIEEDETHLISIISEIQIDMKNRMTDDQINQMINYPEDFRQREKDFNKRKDAQNLRRLFYFNPTEAKAPSLIHLQNRTTSHLNYLIDCKMRYDPNFRVTGVEELIKIFSTSFMIIAQPHSGFNPVLISDRKGRGIYGAKVSVIIVSLLYDFMETHPNMIELDDFEPILCPRSNLYKLDESQKLSWMTCQLQLSPNEKPRTILYAELSGITIKQSPPANKPIHFGEELHSFNFPITLRLNLTEYKISKTYQIPLESLPFAITCRAEHIPHFLTKVIIDDIRRFSKLPSIDIKIVLNFMLRYFIHRTGVEPKRALKIYLEEELTKAMNVTKNFQTLENIFMDFLIPFVHQIEFMAKHPILAMFYVDGFFLGPCNSTRVAEIIRESSDINSPIVALRFNSIKVDYTPNASATASSKIIKPTPCAVRVDVYDTRTKSLQNHTFDPLQLTKDICKFVSTAKAENAGYIRILSNFGDKTDSKIYKSYKDFTKYYDDQLHEIFKTDSRYQEIVDLLRHIEENGNNQHVHNSQTTNLSEISRDNPRTISSVSTVATNDEYTFNGTDVYNLMVTPDARSDANKTPLQNDFFPSNPQPLPLFNDQDVIQYVLDRPNIFVQLVRQSRSLQVSSALRVQQQQQLYSSQLQMSYTNQQASFPYQQQSSSTPLQMHSPCHPQFPTMPFPSQPQTFNHQQQRSSYMMVNQPTNVNICEQLPVFPSNGIQRPSQQQPIQAQENNPSPTELNTINQPSWEPTNEDNQQAYQDIFSFFNGQ